MRAVVSGSTFGYRFTCHVTRDGSRSLIRCVAGRDVYRAAAEVKCHFTTKPCPLFGGRWSSSSFVPFRNELYGCLKSISSACRGRSKPQFGVYAVGNG